MLCVPGYGPMQYAVYVFMLVDMFMLCYVLSVSGFRSDAGGKAPVSPDFGPMQWARPNMCFICYCMVCGSLGGLTKLHVYGLSFWFQVLSFQKRSSGRLQCTHHSQLAWECLTLIMRLCFEFNTRKLCYDL